MKLPRRRFLHLAAGASALCRTRGEAGKPLSIISDLIVGLTGEPPGLQTINAASFALGEALGDRRILMIVDYAWREADLRPLWAGSIRPGLITTRLDNILPDNAVRQSGCGASAARRS
jgi:hypothetical protein